MSKRWHGGWQASVWMCGALLMAGAGMAQSHHLDRPPALPLAAPPPSSGRSAPHPPMTLEQPAWPEALVAREQLLRSAREWRAAGTFEWTPPQEGVHRADFVWRRVGSASALALTGNAGAGGGLLQSSDGWKWVDASGQTTPTSADEVAEVLRLQLGAPLSMDRLQAWMRAMPAEGDTAWQLDGQHRPKLFMGEGWTATYTQWADDVPMPAQMTLTHAHTQPLVITIQRWAALPPKKTDLSPEL